MVAIAATIIFITITMTTIVTSQVWCSSPSISHGLLGRDNFLVIFGTAPGLVVYGEYLIHLY